MSDILKIPAGETLLHEGEESREMYYVQEGTLAVFKRKDDYNSQQIGTIYSGEVVGEMSFLDKSPRCATVKAISDCTLVVVPSETLENLYKDLPIWYRALVNTLLERLRKANARIRI